MIRTRPGVRLLPALAALAACVALAPGALSARVESLALFIGVDEGLPQDRALRYASRDALRMAEVIRELGTYDKDRIYLLANPSLPKVLSALEEIRGRVKELRKSGAKTSVLIYYSGHGSAEGLHIRGRRLGRAEVNALVESLESDLKIVILDACESGDFLRRKGGTLLEDREIVKQDDLRSQGTIVLSSSARGEAAQESEDYKGAVFSHHLINGLRGLADYNSDGQVSLLEVFDYARASTRMEEVRGQGPRQNPAFDFDVVGESDPVLARLERVRSRLLLRRMPATALEVYDARTQELEQRIFMTARDSAYYYLPSGRFVLRYGDGEGWRVKAVDLTWTAEVAVSPRDFRRQGRSLLTRKGGKGGLSAGLDLHGVQLASRRAAPFLGNPLFGGEYVFRTYGLKQSLGLAFGRQTGAPLAEDIRVDTDVWRTGYSARKAFLTLTYAQAQAGVDLAWHRVRQTVRDGRFGGEPVRLPDGSVLAAVRTAESHVLEAGLPLEVELYFPMRLWVGLSAAGTVYRYRDRATGESGWHPRLEPGLTLGHQF